MKFPYGVRDFYALRIEGYLYIDRTDRIPLIEEAGKELTFLRPRRFGKSLLLSMLENYYDVARADDFERLFGDLAIGRNPTARHNQYLVMKWDFSSIKTYGSVQVIEQALYNYLNERIHNFAVKYRHLLSIEIAVHPTDAIASFYSMLTAVQQTPYKLYLLVDEYDNFANEVMMALGNTSQQRYETLVSGEGMLKTIFKNIKGAGAGEGLDRLFMTGVSPIVLSDLTSGHNVSENIYWSSEFHDLCGFREDEVKSLVAQVITQCGLPSEKGDEALALMRVFYNGSRFTFKEAPLIYNPTSVFHFLKHLQHECAYPERILDVNLAPDSQKLVYISQHLDGEQLLLNALNEDAPLTVSEVGERFGIREMLATGKRRDHMASLLCYLGALTLAGRTLHGKVILKIPNLVMRQLYIERLFEMALPNSRDQDAGRDAAEALYQHGLMQPLCDFVEQTYFRVFDNRDYFGANELTIKTAFLTLLYNDQFYIMDSEAVLERTYADLIMILRPEMRRYQLLDILIEFKFVKLAELELTGNALRQKTAAELRQMTKVKHELDQARTQLQDYRRKLVARYGALLRLRTYAVVAVGFERLVWEEVI